MNHVNHISSIPRPLESPDPAHHLPPNPEAMEDVVIWLLLTCPTPNVMPRQMRCGEAKRAHLRAKRNEAVVHKDCAGRLALENVGNAVAQALVLEPRLLVLLLSFLLFIPFLIIIPFVLYMYLRCPKRKNRVMWESKSSECVVTNSSVTGLPA